MSRRRLNIKFIVILVLVIALGASGLMGLRWWNAARANENLYTQAMELYQNGEKMDEAVHLFGQYVYAGKDDAKKADCYLKVATYYQNNVNKVTPQNVDMVHRMMQKALDNDPENRVLREGIAKAYTAMRRYQQASELYGQLSKQDPNRPELLYALAENLIAANQINDAGVTLAILIDKAPPYIPGHLLYATYTEQILGRPDDAENIMDNMVDSNLQSAAAYARRSIYRMDHKNEKGALEDLNSALQLEPEEADTIVAAVNFYIKTRDFEKAHEYLGSVSEKDKDNDDISNLRIRLADAEKRPDDAIAELMKRLEKRDNFILRIQLFDRLVATKKLDEAHRQIDHLKKMKMNMEMIGFFESAIDIVQNNWQEAARKLELSRSIFSMHPETVAFVDRQLALCYGKLGQTDKQIEAFQRAIQNTPQTDILPISIAYILALNSANKTALLEEAIKDLITKIGVTMYMEIPQLRAIRIALEIQKMANLPQSMQDWSKIQTLLEESGVEKDSPEAVLLGVRLLLKQGKSEEARTFLKQAIAKNPDFTGFVSYLALMEAQLKNYDVAVRILDDEIRKKGILPALLIIKTRILAQMPAEKAGPMLTQMENGSKELPDATKIVVLKQIAPAWIAVGNDDNAKRIFEELSRMEPDNMGTKIQLFDLARKMNNETEMNAQMDKVRMVSGNLSPEYRYCQAAKLIWQYLQKKVTLSQLSEAKAILRQAQNSRGNWPNIPRALAELALLEKDYPAAIEHLTQVDSLGALTTQQLELLIKLLYNEKRGDEIPTLLSGREGTELSPDTELLLIDKLADIDGASAMERAKGIIEGSQNPGDYLWQGNVALRAGDYRAAEISFEKVVELAPESSTGWIALLQTMRLLDAPPKRMNDLVARMRKALSAEKLPLAEAKAMQLIGDAPAAEAAFLKAVELAPTDLEALYSTSSFYLRTTRPELGEPYLLKMVDIITADNSSDPRTKAQRMAWARRSLADIYRLTPDYDRQQKALMLVNENLRLEPDSAEDKKTKGLVLAARRNPREQAMGLKLLEEVSNQLLPTERFTLAKLFDMQSVSSDSRLMWERCRRIMSELAHPNSVTNPEYLVAYIDMLLRRQQAVSDIQPYLEKLEELAPNTPAAIALRARLMVREDNKAGAERMLISMVPLSITEENAATVRQIASLLELIESIDGAERVWQKLANEMPKGAWDYTAFLGRHSRVNDGLTLLEKHQGEFNRMEMMDAMSRLFRSTKRRGTPADFARAERILQACKAEAGDEIGVGIFRGQLQDIQEDYNGAIKTYDNLLKEPKITDSQRAFVQNNLAYILAMTGKDNQRAMKLINEAMTAHGNEAQLLDTQAMVLLKSNERANIDQAIQNLEKVVLMKPEALFFFHLAVAYNQKDDRTSARVAFETAKQLDPNLAQSISKLESEDFSNLAKLR